MQIRIFILLLILLFSFPSVIFANNYTYTVQAVFNRLEGLEVNKSQNELQTEPKATQQETSFSPEESEQAETEKENPAQAPGAEYRIAPVPSFEGSIMERLQRESTLSLDGLNRSIDNFGTSLYYTISQALIGIAPIVLVIGALFVMFSRGKGIGLLMLFGALLFTVLFAPEIVKFFISIIQGIFS